MSSARRGDGQTTRRRREKRRCQQRCQAAGEGPRDETGSPRQPARAGNAYSPPTPCRGTSMLGVLLARGFRAASAPNRPLALQARALSSLDPADGSRPASLPTASQLDSPSPRLEAWGLLPIVYHPVGSPQALRPFGSKPVLSGPEARGSKPVLSSGPVPLVALLPSESSMPRQCLNSPDALP